MGSLLEKLALLLVDEYKLVKGAKRQIKLLQKELEVMNIFMKHISQEEDPDDLYKHQANAVRELSYDIEDSIDEFKLRVERNSNSKPHGCKGFVERCVNLLTTMKIRHKHAKEFQDLLSRAKDVSERHKRYDFHGSISKPNNATIDFDIMTTNGTRQRNLSRRNLMALFEEDFVGIDRPRDKLIQLMNEEGAPAHQLKVLSIVGPGGIGKTTLATKIRDKLEGQFQCRALVSVSQRPNISRILRRILEEVGFKCDNNANMELWAEDKLISELRNFLSGMRFFIVIDDIWDAEVWKTVLKHAFPDSNGSRIITTTRHVEVGKACCSNPSYVYEMELLSDHDSNKLFFQRIFGSEDPSSQNFKEASAKILKKCDNLPLAIITISSFLASEPDNERKWEYVLDYLNSLGSNLELNPGLSKTREILNLSYTHLPDYLKTCMLYLGIYPEDYTIDRNDLVRQWVAQDFVCKAHVGDPENGANIYFDELINRSMIQPVEIDSNGKVMSCKIHDMMLDLILSKCRDLGLEQNFITVIDKIQDVTGQSHKIRRLSLHMDGAVDYQLIGSDQRSGIRTLARFAVTSDSHSLWWSIPTLILEFDIPKGSPSSYLPTFEQFRHLRVLTIEILGGSRKSVLLDFTGIQVLFQLRYLKIVAESDPVVLPPKIGALQQLETIHLQTKVISAREQTFEKLPLDIVHMSGLLHLIFPLWRTLPNGDGNMKSLRTLRYFNLCNNTLDNIRGLRELTNLTELEVGYRSVYLFHAETGAEVAERGKEVLRACLEKLCNLKYLKISTDYGACLDVLCSVPASCHLERFYVSCSWFSRAPEWIGQLHRLYVLYLNVTEVLEEDVAMLAQLRSLIHLGLTFEGTPKDKIIVRGTGFSSLKRFTVICSRTSCLTFEAGAMAKLQKLELNFNALGWDRYGAAPTGIEYISSLNEITVNIGGSGANESDRRAAESALRDACAKHPSRPTVNIKCREGFQTRDSIYVFDKESKGEEDVEEECEEQEDDVSCST